MSIPIIYDEEGKPHKVPENMLPVKLPDIKVRTNWKCIDKELNWKNVKINGKNYTRETDTLIPLLTLLGIFKILFSK